MLLKKGLLLLLTLATVKGQLDDCQTSASIASSANSQNDSLCPTFEPPATNENSTIFSVLNSTDSPVPQFMKIINASGEFQPFIDLLSSPGNLTVFLPCNEALEHVNLTSFLNQTNNTANGGNNETASFQTRENMVISPVLNHLFGSFNTVLDEEGNKTQRQDNVTWVISEGLGNFSVIDILRYHVLNGTWPSSNITNGTHINSTLMSNETAYPLATFVPLVINNTYSASSMNNSDSMGNETTNGIVASNVSAASNVTSNITVGNGIGYAKIIVANITTSNGIIHIIDKVLVPPVATVSTVKQLNISSVNKYLNGSSNATSLLNSLTNVTIFLPSQRALDASMEGMDNMGGQQNDTDMAGQQIIKAHIVNGTYYTTNLTDTPVNVTTLNSTSLELKGSNDNTTYQVNNATIIRPNILTDSGVIHIIDQVLQPAPTASSPPNDTSSSPTDTATATATPQPANQSSGSTLTVSYQLVYVSVLSLIGYHLLMW